MYQCINRWMGRILLLLRAAHQSFYFQGVIDGALGDVLQLGDLLDSAALLRNFISFYHQAYRAAVWRSRHNYLGLCHSR
jgi:hypothetical protein